MSALASSFERERFETRDYGPDFSRQIAEPMTLEYLRSHLGCCERVWWSEGDLPNGKYLDQKHGIDGILELRSEEGERILLAVQVTSANLQNKEAREGALRKMRAWAKNPVYKLDGEAETIAAREGEPVPIVFFHVNSADVHAAWERRPRPDWRAEEARKAAEDAAKDLPDDPRYLQLVLSSIAVSIDTIAAKPGYGRLLKPYQETIRRELENLKEKL